jgi:TP53 regulating kinase-like protein
MHDAGIIHGDLTTSNMMLRESKVEKLVFIDFGLSCYSTSDEDKAVDLYVLERALISTHPNSEEFSKQIVQSYKESSKFGVKVMKKLEAVRARGRKRDMNG